MSATDLAGVRAVYFDLDDTLCPYWEASKFGLYRAFERHPVDGYSSDEMMHFWGLAFREFAPALKESVWYTRYLADGGSTRLEQMRLALIHANFGGHELAQQLADSYAEERDRALRLFEDAQTVLDAWHGKLPLGLITNGPADVQRQEIATLGVAKYFDNIFIEGEMGFGKPHPEVFERAEKAVGFRGEQMLFVGNSYRQDILPARERGWRTVWIRRPSDLPPGLLMPEHKPEGGPEPDLTIGDLKALLPLISL